MDVYHYLYLSRFAGRVGDTGLRDILQCSREQNVKLGVTGALLFDGERFVQLLEGPREVVIAMVERIRRDVRHVDFKALYEGPARPADAPRCRRWLAGYAELEAVAAFERQLGSSSDTARSPVDQFMALLGAADVE